MDTKRGSEKEFSFIQEKVVSRRKNKIKRFLISLVTTLFLAVIFGIVARITFIKSESFLLDLFGFGEEERHEVLFPSNKPDETGAPQVSVTPELTQGAGLTEPPENLSPTPNPSGGEINDPLGSEEGIEKQGTTIIENKIGATLEDYQAMYTELKKLANSCYNSLATVTAIESGVDWFNDAYETRRTSTGIVIGENNVDMLILTTLDRVQKADSIEVTFSGNLSLPGVVWDYDSDYNLAVIAVQLRSIPSQQLKTIKPATFGESYALTVGTPILALGNPNGYSGSMEAGMITSKGSAYYVTDSKFDLFHMDITNTPQSDGVIVNLSGEIIGIITNTFKEELSQNLSTAIGITKLNPIIKALANKEERVYFGILGEDIPNSVLQEIEIENGIYVTEVIPDSPAFEAGLRQGDIITLINEAKVSSMSGFSTILGTHTANETVKVTIQRMSKQLWKEVELEVTLQSKNK